MARQEPATKEAPVQPSPFCQHVSTAGRRCRLPVAEDHRYLCAKHRPAQKARPDDEAIAAELLDGVEDFSSPASVNTFLGYIATALARKRIKRSDAVALAYVNQLILNSQAAIERENQGNPNYYGLPIGMAPTPTGSSDGGNRDAQPAAAGAQ
jgi:hypothetical protein